MIYQRFHLMGIIFLFSYLLLNINLHVHIIKLVFLGDFTWVFSGLHINQWSLSVYNKSTRKSVVLLYISTLFLSSTWDLNPISLIGFQLSPSSIPCMRPQWL
ncbi:hypothetical protein SAY87_011850 [Trapa incisa]|uniref:Uncharacterized protein n=1 Tax=Trapa incisa TaxID=236973 RepID=A0AAN7JJM6_9MYRT|nr:hypothetical protein SAY87_011850 [Trapa incisa]